MVRAACSQAFHLGVASRRTVSVGALEVCDVTVVVSDFGAALARLETKIALDCLLDFMPDFEVDHDGVERTHLTSVNGYSRVPVRVGQPR